MEKNEPMLETNNSNDELAHRWKDEDAALEEEEQFDRYHEETLAELVHLPSILQQWRSEQSQIAELERKEARRRKRRIKRQQSRLQHEGRRMEADCHRHRHQSLESSPSTHAVSTLSSDANPFLLASSHPRLSSSPLTPLSPCSQLRVMHVSGLDSWGMSGGTDTVTGCADAYWRSLQQLPSHSHSTRLNLPMTLDHILSS